MYIIVTNIGTRYPVGFASTSRVNLYARGIVEAGGQVLVLCPGPSEYPNMGILNREVKGVRNGVAFEYTCGTTTRGKTMFQQKLLVLKGLLVSAQRIWNVHKTAGVNGILLFSDRMLTTVLYWLLARACQTKYVSEQNEQPFYQAEHSFFWKVVSFGYTHFLFPLFDGAIVISEFLMKYMRKRMRRGAGLLKVPILIDVEEFTPVESEGPLAGEYIAYCGSWIEDQDGMHTLMKAFAAIHNDFPYVKLVLIGDSTRISSIPKYRLYAERLAISDQVVFTGFLNRSDLIMYLSHATMLVLAKSRNRQSEAAFPTKLGEYLATGQPVLVTKTIQIAAYLTDEVDIYFALPEDIESIANRMRYILTHKKEACEVGRRGRETAIRYFDYKENGKIIKEFIDHITV